MFNSLYRIKNKMVFKAHNFIQNYIRNVKAKRILVNLKDDTGYTLSRDMKKN